MRQLRPATDYVYTETCGELDLHPATVRLHAVDTVRLPVGYPSATTAINDDQPLRNLEIYLKSWEMPHFNLILFEFPQPILDPQIGSGAATSVYTYCVYTMWTQTDPLSTWDGNAVTVMNREALSVYPVELVERTASRLLKYPVTEELSKWLINWLEKPHEPGVRKALPCPGLASQSRKTRQHGSINDCLAQLPTIDFVEWHLIPGGSLKYLPTRRMSLDVYPAVVRLLNECVSFPPALLVSLRLSWLLRIANFDS
ncbi:hypothetical protein DFH09DRAFT_1080907 [Mycena vulgaris]|nr:hypothetical protein DFH09DRAFT_1080907 [Mycena vulgaris]